MNPQSVTNTAGKLAGGITLATIFLVPITMMPITSNFFETNKLMLLILSTALLIIIWSVKTALTQKLSLRFNLLSVPLLVFGLIHFLSSFISTPQTPAEALMDRGSLILALALFVFMAANLIESRKFVKSAIYALVGSGTLLAIVTIFQSFGFGLSNLINQLTGSQIPNTLAFTPAGSPVALLSFLAPVMLLGLFLAFTKKDAAEKVSLFVLTSIMAAAFIVTSVYSFPGKDTAPIFLPFRTGYAIAIETLKNPKTALIGVGTNSFVVAYNQFRPGFMNGSEFWNIRFNVSTNELFQLLTTVGVIGLGVFIWLVSTMFKANKLHLSGTQSQAIKATAFAVLLLFVLLPATQLLYFALAVLLLLWGLQLQQANHFRFFNLEADPLAHRPQTAKKLAIFTPPALLGIAAIFSLYVAGRAYAAEVTFKKAIDAAAKNDGVKTYDLQRNAILQNPYLARYRRAYASTNLALANSIAGNQELTDQDKQNIAQLIQQSIREAKVAVSLEPQNAANWENLGTIYRSLINAAEGADQWTIAALTQAIQTDPVNPRLRVDLGGVYFSLGAFDQAIRLFQQAAELKPDYANAYYNLSHSYLQKKDVVGAYDAMQQVLTLVQPDSADYTKAKEELAELAKSLPKQEQTQAQQEVNNTAPAKTNLNAPSPAPSPATSVNLPAGSGPENVGTTQPIEPSTDINP